MNNEQKTQNMQYEEYDFVLQGLRFSDAMGYLKRKYGLQRKGIIKDLNEEIKRLENNNPNNLEIKKLKRIHENTLTEYARKTYIPKEFLEFLHKKYNINPQYIRGSSIWLTDVYAEQLDALKMISNNWASVSDLDSMNSIEKECIVLGIDSHFYNYLVALILKNTERLGNLKFTPEEIEDII